MEKNAEALLACLQIKIGEQLKGLREEIINQQRFHLPRLSEGSMEQTPIRGRRLTRLTTRLPSATGEQAAPIT
jgi:hypothetical protein